MRNWKLGEILAGLSRFRLQGRAICKQRRQCMIENLFDAAKVAVPDFLFDDPLLLGFELDSHEGNSP